MTRDDLFDLPQDELAGRAIEAEAGGEGLIGKVAVANVFMRRVKADLNNDGKDDWWGEGIQGVLLKPMQFSCFNEGEPSLERILNNKAPAESLTIARLAIHGLLPDVTGGADHYCRFDAWPPWRSRKSGDGKFKVIKQINNHLFFDSRVLA